LHAVVLRAASPGGALRGLADFTRTLGAVALRTDADRRAAGFRTGRPAGGAATVRVLVANFARWATSRRVLANVRPRGRVRAATLAAASLVARPTIRL